jgi:hypothetical protein
VCVYDPLHSGIQFVNIRLHQPQRQAANYVNSLGLLLLEFGRTIALITMFPSQKGKRSLEYALFCLVADTHRTGCGHLHRPAQSPHSQLAGASLSAGGDRRFRLAARLARSGSELRRHGACSPDQRFCLLDGLDRSRDDVPRLLEQHYDVIIIDLDSDPEYALELVESICANGAATVMVYSEKPIRSCWCAACAPAPASF